MMGQRTALAALRTRLLRLGAEMSSQLFRVVLQLPVPFRTEVVKSTTAVVAATMVRWCGDRLVHG